MALENFAQEKVWLDKSKNTDAEPMDYEKQSEILKCESLRDKNEKVTPANITNCKVCLICDTMTQIYLHNDVSKLLDEIQQWDKIDSKTKDSQYKIINKFECLVCSFKTSQFNDWKCHIMSLTHLAENHRIKNVYSYVCVDKKCKLLLYGSKESLNKHNIDNHFLLKNDLVCHVSTFMAEIMKRFLAADLSPLFYCSHCNKFEKEPIHNDVKSSRKKIKVPYEYYCQVCKVQFLSSQEMIDYHFVSVEHLTIKCFDKLCSKAKMNPAQIKLSEEFNQNNENNLFGDFQKVFKTNSINMPNIILTKSSTTEELKNVPLSQKYDDITSEHLTNLQKNESLTNFDYDGTTLLDNTQQVQKPVVNNNFLEELNNDVQDHNNKSNENVMLTPNHSKLRKNYSEFNSHRITVVKKLMKYIDVSMKTLSYYCDDCDFITKENHLWDKHNKTAHSTDFDRSTVYCSTCAMFICGDDQEHQDTVEHIRLLSLLDYLPSKYPINMIFDKSSYKSIVESSSDENLTELNNTDCFKGRETDSK